MTVMRKLRCSSPRPIVAIRSRDPIAAGRPLAVEASYLARRHVAALRAAIAAYEYQGCSAQGKAPSGFYGQARACARTLVHGRAYGRGQGAAAGAEP